MNVIRSTFALAAMIIGSTATAADVYTFNDWSVRSTPPEESRARTGPKNEKRLAICHMENWKGSYGIVAYKIIAEFDPIKVEFRRKKSTFGLFEEYDWSALEEEGNEIVLKVDKSEHHLLLDKFDSNSISKLKPSIDYEKVDLDELLSETGLKEDADNTKSLKS